MNSRHFLPIISLCVLTIAPVPQLAAKSESFLDALLRFTGISITADKVKGVDNFINGNIWLVHIEAAGSGKPQQITHDGTYHTPLWMPGSLNIIAMKGGNLVRLNAQSAEEKTLYVLPDTTALLGFDKNDPNRVLVLQESLVGVLALASGKITPIPYDKDKPEEYRKGLDQLMSGYRDYGTTQVEIKNQLRHDSRNKFQQLNTINIKRGNKDIPISCPSACDQPALTEDGQQLLFIGD